MTEVKEFRFFGEQMAEYLCAEISGCGLNNEMERTVMKDIWTYVFNIFGACGWLIR